MTEADQQLADHLYNQAVVDLPPMVPHRAFFNLVVRILRAPAARPLLAALVAELVEEEHADACRTVAAGIHNTIATSGLSALRSVHLRDGSMFAAHPGRPNPALCTNATHEHSLAHSPDCRPRPLTHTPPEAAWCHICGECACVGDGHRVPGCPLHGIHTTHTSR